MRRRISRSVSGMILLVLLFLGFTQMQAQGIVICTTSLSNATIFAAYSATLQSSGGTAPVTWSISSGSLPAGLSLDPSTGIISGAPTAAGTASFTVTVTDSTSATANQALTLTTSAPTWLIGESGITAISSQSFLNVLAQPGQPAPFIILATKKDVDGVANDCANNSPTAFDTTPPAANWPITPVYMYRYTAECQFEVDLAQGAIPAWITWIMYDNELCTLPGTPLNEQMDPPTYYTQAATEAHNNGFSFMATAGLHAAMSTNTQNCGPADPSYDPQTLWATAGPAGAASAWDAVDFQTQTGIANPAGLLNNALAQLRNALNNNPNVVGLAGIGDLGKYYVQTGSGRMQVAGPIDQGTQEEAVQLLLENGISGFWGNYGPHPLQGSGQPGAGFCTDTYTTTNNGTPVCPIPALYTQYGSIITDFYNGTLMPPSGSYPQQ